MIGTIYQVFMTSVIGYYSKLSRFVIGNLFINTANDFFYSYSGKN